MKFYTISFYLFSNGLQSDRPTKVSIFILQCKNAGSEFRLTLQNVFIFCFRKYTVTWLQVSGLDEEGEKARKQGHLRWSHSSQLI